MDATLFYLILLFFTVFLIILLPFFFLETIKIEVFSWWQRFDGQGFAVWRVSFTKLSSIVDDSMENQKIGQNDLHLKQIHCKREIVSFSMHLHLNVLFEMFFDKFANQFEAHLWSFQLFVAALLIICSYFPVVFHWLQCFMDSMFAWCKQILPNLLSMGQLYPASN